MTAQAPASTGQQLARQRMAERGVWSAPGVPVLAAGTVLLVVGIGLLIRAIQQGAGTDHKVLGVVAVVLLIGGLLAFHGLTPVVAGEARVVQLFGSYQRHHPGSRPALGQPVRPAAEGVDPAPQP